MSTHATITARLANGAFASVYLHADGFDAAAGTILRKHYTTQAKIEALISLGNLSRLGAECTKPDDHGFSTPAVGFSVAYTRDRGEPWTMNEPGTGATPHQAADSNEYGLQAYEYVWQDGAWSFTDHDAA